MSDNNPNAKRRSILGATGITLASGLIGSSSAAAQQDGTPEESDDGQSGYTEEDVMEAISEWEDKQHEEAVKTMDKYGVPEIVDERRLIWYDSGPWKRTEMKRDAVPHRFPVEHPDFFEQFIDYGVPTTSVDELTEYDGSVMFERTTGEMSARCHTEWANFLAINLAHDLITGEETVKTARESYAEIVEQRMAGEEHEYTQGLQFERPQFQQRDPDIEIIQQSGEGGS